MQARLKISLTLLAAAGFVLAQDTSSSGWKPIGSSNSGQAPALQQNAPPPGPPRQAGPNLPPELNLKAGTYVMVRVNQTLSSDKNQTGDTFTATVVQPLVVDGFVVAHPAQTFGGKVAEATKANKAQGSTSHLALQLSDLMFVDGQHATIQSELVAVNRPHQGQSSTTVAGVAGAAGSTAGVLLTHGHSTVIKPEDILTFKIDSDVNIATDRAPQAFRPVSPNDYRPSLQAGRPAPAGFYAGYPYYGYPYYGYPYPYPYYWGPGVGLYFGGGWGPGFGFRGRFR
jgi:hypothetical protein